MALFDINRFVCIPPQGVWNLIHKYKYTLSLVDLLLKTIKSFLKQIKLKMLSEYFTRARTIIYHIAIIRCRGFAKLMKRNKKLNLNMNRLKTTEKKVRKSMQKL